MPLKYHFYCKLYFIKQMAQMKMRNRAYNPSLFCRVLVYTSGSTENSRTIPVHKAHELVLLKVDIYYLQAVKSLV